MSKTYDIERPTRSALTNAVKRIVAAWETGDLAAAVNSARALVEDEPQQEPTAASVLRLMLDWWKDTSGVIKDIRMDDYAALAEEVLAEA
jgi:hypothetical protein